jgi:hypothetical protein
MPWQAALRAFARRLTPTALLERPGLQKVLRILPAVAILAWAAAAWFVLRPQSIALDWNSVRQTDTQAIARHMTEPGASLFYPRIDWGGDGPGYVETEFPLYQAMVALMLRLLGDGEWPGQLLSLVATVLAAFVLHGGLRRRLGGLPAAFGLGIFLAAPVTMFGATSVQPDGLALLGFIVAWTAFLRYTDTHELRPLLVYGLCGMLAMLIKPTMAQLGIDAGVYVLVARRSALRSAALWITWVVMALALIVWMRHAALLNAVYGNTFGVLSGYDSKMPKLDHLFMPRLYFRALTITRQWGMGLVGTLAVCWAVVQRRGHAVTLALGIGALVWMIFSLRYSSEYYGTHYTTCATVVAAYAGAQCLAGLGEDFRFPVAVVAALALGLGMQRSIVYRRWQPHEDRSSAIVAEAAREVGQHAHPGDLVIVRNETPAYDHFWRTPFNRNDPRLFYATRTRGWCRSVDVDDAGELESFRERGARFYVEPFGTPELPGVSAWLRRRGRVLATLPSGGHLYALEPAAAP